MFREYQIVTLLKDLPENNLKAGDTGTVLIIYDSGEQAYEVEFIDKEGRSQGVITVKENILMATPEYKDRVY